MTENYFERATNPQQYDEGKLDWKSEGGKESPTRSFFYEYLAPELEAKDKHVLDVGSGMGPLFPLLKKLGAARVVGIEPSKQNIEVAKSLYPEIEVLPVSLETAELNEKFDAAVAVMVFEHIANVTEALIKIKSLLSLGGIFYLITSDKDYYTKQRSGYQIDTEQVDENTVSVKTTRESGIMYDVVRPIDWYITTAERVGLHLHKHIGMKPTKTFIDRLPKYAMFKDQNIAHLLIFKNS